MGDFKNGLISQILSILLSCLVISVNIYFSISYLTGSRFQTLLYQEIIIKAKVSLKSQNCHLKAKKPRYLLIFTFKPHLILFLGLGITHWAFILFTVVCGVLYLIFCVYLTVDMVSLYCTVLNFTVINYTVLRFTCTVP